MTSAQLRGRWVRALEPLGNRLAVLPAGSEWKIEGKFSGLKLESEPCASCGVKLYVTHVRPEAVDLIPLGEDADGGDL